MPIYEYRCGACGHEKEVLQRMSDKPLAKCPECGKRAFHKLVSAAGFQLKGTGWYATDFKNSGAKKPAAKPGKSESKSESKSDKPSESSGKEPTKAAAACGAGACPACS
ncbi:MAG TPA: zinc ribbon domain-containing protein [Burkholderiales bacterium]|nr:zinc ribbon domain-containing protein [Burkholderiales bacterium]